jgi:hypothetical protein
VEPSKDGQITPFLRQFIVPFDVPLCFLKLSIIIDEEGPLLEASKRRNLLYRLRSEYRTSLLS